ncbi:hypothetical protein HPB50_004826 [Hyalomma asiaticum]|uniref:Uncharacterized protein n=1 Tax=Hyalomma asiaticum TaxID=266040 RepID=A0ACB7SQ57_HYAAI|nr:hypothetical protein HPB50_004826 [Hyalomma asiaticum]
MSVFMRNLPRETAIYFALFGVKPSAENRPPETPASERVLLAWTGQALFNSQRELLQGSLFLGFWSPEVDENSGPPQSNDAFSCPVLRLQFPEFDCTVVFPEVPRDSITTCKATTYALDSVVIQELTDVLEKDPLTVPSPEEKKLFWDHRHYILEVPHLLPKVLLSAHSWSWPFLPDLYFLLTEWRPASPINALTLLLPLFPDYEVRRTAVKWIKNIGSDELCDHLPQLIQALRFETWEDAPITWFLLERSLTSVRVAHQMFWLLRQNLDNPLTHKRMKLVIQTLLVIVGKSFRDIIEKQEEHLNQLCIIAESIKDTRESLRLDKLLQDMAQIHSMIEDNPSCLPLNPAMEVCGVDVKSCSYFTSNTLPLRIAYKSSEQGAKPIQVIYKVGDDLRQDMLTLQMIRIMDKFWLKEGLDLKIITFNCVATGKRKGMVEMVTEAETLRRIQTEHGLTGSFKDRPIAEWLQRHNTSELEYQQAVENFTLSCAGYCVATYILGICDRHNDNIMLKTSGHMFHIDFGKFLGDSQINIFITLFELMVTSGVPGVTADAVNFVQKSLLLGSSEGEATAHFTRLIEESLRSRFTQLNFFIHNIAQLRFTGDHNDGLLLSFVPRTFTKDSDGRIVSLNVVRYLKCHEPEKHYTYVVRVGRECQAEPMHVVRTYPEFLELYQKLVRMFPLAKFYPLPKGSLVGRSNTREVAQRRMQELDAFLMSLTKMAEEVSHCSLVYTFFHPLLRDQEGMAEDENECDNLRQISQRVNLSKGIVGRIKLSIVYKASALSIMVMHAENLACLRKSLPDCYIKTYLHPDPEKVTKRKTKVVFKNNHPTFMEMLEYNYPHAFVAERVLEVSAWDHDRVQENEFLGAAIIDLARMDLTKESTHWYHLNAAQTGQPERQQREPWFQVCLWCSRWVMAYPGTQADWYYDGAVRPRRGIHDVWASQRSKRRPRSAGGACCCGSGWPRGCAGSRHTRRSPLEKLKELFAESTTGIDRLVVIENRCRFWIFCTVYVVFFIVTVISIGKTLQNHFEYRDIVSISMTEGNSLQLPAVTFCNLNPLRISAVCSPRTLELINGTIRNILCDQEGPMDIDTVYNFTTEELLPFLNIARKYNNSQTLYALGHTKQKMVLNCTVKGESCLDDRYERSRSLREHIVISSLYIEKTPKFCVLQCPSPQKRA